VTSRNYIHKLQSYRFTSNYEEISIFQWGQHWFWNCGSVLELLFQFWKCNSGIFLPSRYLLFMRNMITRLPITWTCTDWSWRKKWTGPAGIDKSRRSLQLLSILTDVVEIKIKHTIEPGQQSPFAYVSEPFIHSPMTSFFCGALIW